eukprot:m.44495 g.44495  ORF g.44495 m.44495 type:complete len:242 (-) comp17271_c1_seq1:51-776(-)
MSAVKVFEDMANVVNADMVKKVGAIYQWNITDDSKKVLHQYTVDLKSGSGSIYKGPAKTRAGCTLTLSEKTLDSLVAGKLDPMKAFMSGALKVSGNIMLAQKIQPLMKAHRAGAGAAKSAPSAAAPTSDLQAETVFAEIEKQLTPDVAAKVKAIFQWNITKGGKTAGVWTVDLKNGGGSVYKGPAKQKATCTLTLSDDTLVALVSGKQNAMKAFMGGKLKIGGNLMMAQKLEVLFKQKSKL